MLDLYKAKERLEKALKKKRSEKWCLFLWGKFIKLRDENRCLICDSTCKLQAHHIFRKSTIKLGKYELGNGITLCDSCHDEAHSSFNGKSDLTKPLNYEGGDDQDLVAYLYKLLHDDAKSRGIDENSFYYMSDELLLLFIRFQGYEYLYEAMKSGDISRIAFSYLIWQPMPEKFYETLACSLFKDLKF